ncbi:hypothetical protein ONZ45_g14721 [Pleurotus djamor]|nr:hypothetical protein ONZ45_g14721 [Pleurotus djamor]
MLNDLNVPDLQGKVAIVTGANRGMGFQLAQQLAIYGAKVYLAARSEAAVNQAIERIEVANPSLQGKNMLIYLHLDLSTLKGTKESAERFLQLESKLDILIHNAAVLAHPFAKSSEGLEDSMAVNHFGPFVFTQVLFDLLVSSAKDADVRVISVASFMHSRAPKGGMLSTLDEINDPLASPCSQDGMTANSKRYSRSKLANILFAKELQRKFKEAGSTALSIAINPGGVATEGVMDQMDTLPIIGGLAKYAVGRFAKSPLDGARTALWAATSPKVRTEPDVYGGAYLVPYDRLETPSKDACDDSLAKVLWGLSEQVSKDILTQ